MGKINEAQISYSIPKDMDFTTELYFRFKNLTVLLKEATVTYKL